MSFIGLSFALEEVIRYFDDEELLPAVVLS
jgi:hypothetical protein